MFKISSFILIFIVQNSLQAQTNLIGNGSFEDVDNDVKNELNNSEFFYGSHLSYNEDVSSLFLCWHSEDNFVFGNVGGYSLSGISYGIIPDLFPKVGGIDNLSFPNVSSAKMVVEEGIDLAEMNKILLQKVEELTLYMLQ